VSNGYYVHASTIVNNASITHDYLIIITSENKIYKIEIQSIYQNYN